MRPSAKILLAALAAASTLCATPAGAETVRDLIPMARVPEAWRAEIEEVCRDATVRCTVPERKVACALETYGFLLNHLELAAVALCELKLGDYAISKDEEGAYLVDDRKGARARAQVVLSEPGRLVLFARGRIEARLMPRIAGNAVIVIRSRRDPSVPSGVLSDCHIDFRFDSGLLRVATRPFRAFVASLLESKLAALVDCAGTIAARCEKEPANIFAVLSGASAPPTSAQLAQFRSRFLDVTPATAPKSMATKD